MRRSVWAVVSLAELNAAAPEDFVARLGTVFEHSPWVAERAWMSTQRHRPLAIRAWSASPPRRRIADG